MNVTSSEWQQPKYRPPRPCQRSQRGYPVVHRHKGSFVIRVTVMHDSLGIKTELGTVEFFCTPVRSRWDYRCSKTNLLSFGQAKQIGDSLTRGVITGRANCMEWRKE